MLKALLKVQWAIFVSIFTGSARSKKKQSAGKIIGFTFLMIYALGALMFLFFHLFDTIAGPFRMLGLDWFYFTMMWLIAFALMFIGSVFTAKAQLFEAKDNERLLAMPIPAGMILLSRMLTLYLLNFFFGILVIAPAVVVWVLQCGFTAMGIVSLIVLTLTMPMLAMAVSCLIAWLISLIVSRVEKKSLVTMVFSVAFLGVYFVFCARMNVYITRLAENGALLAGKLGAVKPLLWLGDAVANGNAISLLLSVLVTVLPLAVVYYLLARAFISVVTAERAAKKKVYRREAMQVQSPNRALLRRELAHLGASPSYMLNAGMGILFLIAGGVVLLVKKQAVLELLQMLGLPLEQLVLIAALGCCLILSMVIFTAPSPSMEGKSYWVLRAMPITTMQIIGTKLLLAELVTLLPTLFLIISFAIALKLTVLQILLLAACVLAYMELTAVFGMMTGIRHARLDWLNETQAVKQSIGVLTSMLFGMGLVAAMAIPYYVFLFKSFSPLAYMAICTAVMLAAVLLIRQWISTKGVRRYEELA